MTDTITLNLGHDIEDYREAIAKIPAITGDAKMAALAFRRAIARGAKIERMASLVGKGRAPLPLQPRPPTQLTICQAIALNRPES